MHELHLMTQIVKSVETQLQDMRDARLSVVRLKVSALSHLLTHDHSALQTTFELAAQGTKAEGAMLEIIPVPDDARCSSCNRGVTAKGLDDICSVCGEPMVANPAVPEVVLHELVVTE